MPDRPDPARKETVPGRTDTTQGTGRNIRRIPAKGSQDDRRGSRSGRAYVAMPEIVTSGAADGMTNVPAPRKDWRKSALVYLLIAVVIAGVAGGGYYAWQHSSGTSTSQVLMLSASDIDEQLTKQARESLQRGEVPPYLRNASQQVLEKIKNGEMDLTQKQLFDPTKASGLMIHVYVSIDGQLALTDVLTEQHPRTTIIPVSRKSVTHFHFVVDSAGATGSVTCFADSSEGIVLHTPPLVTGSQADLEMQRR